MSADLSTPARFEPGARIGSYLLERTLGAGGMGTVYAARHIGLDKPVAIKALAESLASRTESVLRFVREGRAASKIRHPHVVDVTDVGTHDGVPFLVMEYLEGEDLQTRLKASGALAPAEIARVMLPVLDAVATAHELGVVHRDLKPSNVFLARGPHGRETPKVLDFGIAKILDRDADDRASITQAATFLGTPFYCSPEQARSSRSADARSDQYSLGVILFELTTGSLPVRGGNLFEVLTAIIAGNVDRLRTRPDVDPTLAALVDRAMAHDPGARFGSVRELGRALLAVADPSVRAQWTPVFDPRALSPSTPRDRSPDSYAATLAAEGVLPSLPPSAAPSGEPTGPATPVAPALVPATAAAPVVPSASVPPPAFTPPAPPTSAAAAIPPASTPPSAARPARRARGAGLLLAAAVVVIIAALGGGALWWLGREPTARVARVIVEAEPRSARIELDGVEAGAGEASLELADDDRVHRLRVSAPGHRASEISFRGAASPTHVVLTPEPRPTPIEELAASPLLTAPTPLEPAPTQPPPVEPAPTVVERVTTEPPPSERPDERRTGHLRRRVETVTAEPAPTEPALVEVDAPRREPVPRTRPVEQPIVRPFSGAADPPPVVVRPPPIRSAPARGANNAPILD